MAGQPSRPFSEAGPAVVVGTEVVVAAPLGAAVGAPLGGRLPRRLVRRARSFRVCRALSLYLREHRRARWRFSEHRGRPPVMVIFVRERITRAAAPRLARVRMVSACPAFSLYLREHDRARWRSTEHSGRPPLIRTVTRELAANTVPPPPAIKTPASADTARRRLMRPCSRGQSRPEPVSSSVPPSESRRPGSDAVKRTLYPPASFFTRLDGAHPGHSLRPRTGGL
jgi:hypothetical protein